MGPFAPLLPAATVPLSAAEHLRPFAERVGMGPGLSVLPGRCATR